MTRQRGHRQSSADSQHDSVRNHSPRPSVSQHSEENSRCNGACAQKDSDRLNLLRGLEEPLRLKPRNISTRTMLSMPKETTAPGSIRTNASNRSNGVNGVPNVVFSK